ncbi:MAG: hypothetical protein M0P69_03190 [Bacteroidales bacterium]|nr:hypothetical protein [Bacteroidales bacterium]
MDDNLKDTEIQIKISSRAKEDFYRKCKKQAINPSAWLRKKIYEFLEKPLDGHDVS